MRLLNHAGWEAFGFPAIGSLGIGAGVLALQLSDAVIDNVAETIAITANRPTTLNWLVSDTAAFSDIDEAVAAVAGADASGSVALTEGGGPYTLDFGAATGNLYFTHWAEGVGPFTQPITISAAASSLVDHDFTTDLTGDPIYIGTGTVAWDAEPAQTFNFPSAGLLTGRQNATGGSAWNRALIYVPVPPGNYELDLAATYYKGSSTGGIQFISTLDLVNAYDSDAGIQNIATFFPQGTATSWTETVIADGVTPFTMPASGFTHIRMRMQYSAWNVTAHRASLYKFKLDPV